MASCYPLSKWTLPGPRVDPHAKISHFQDEVGTPREVQESADGGISAVLALFLAHCAVHAVKDWLEQVTERGSVPGGDHHFSLHARQQL